MHNALPLHYPPRTGLGQINLVQRWHHHKTLLDGQLPVRLRFTESGNNSGQCFAKSVILVASEVLHTANELIQRELMQMSTGDSDCRGSLHP
eukprot:1157263-Pelagomonas_calceolata.AAC.17